MQSRTSCCRLFLFAALFFVTAVTCVPSSAKDAYLQRWPVQVAAPLLKLNELDGQERTLQSLRGKVIILNFWASWCAPCIDELPFLNALATRGSSSGKLVVLGVNFKESATVIRRFTREHRVDYPILLDKSGESFRQWTSGILPTTILIDRNGKPRWRIVGELDRTDVGLQQALEKMLAEEPNNASHNVNEIRADAK